jgi:hypothetical protein
LVKNKDAAPAEIIERIDGCPAKFVSKLQVMAIELPGIVVEKLPVRVYAVAGI